MPRFVILTHDHPQLHWDLLLEQSPEELLRTWRLERPPEAGEVIEAVALPDHRRVYLDYEGTISGNRGTVSRWDFGEYERLAETPGKIELRLHGQKVQGTAMLTEEGGAWRFSFTGESKIP